MTVLGILVMGWGVVCGGILYEHVAVVPVWARRPPESLTMFRGEHRLRSERFWMTVHPLLLVLFVVALVVGWGDADVRTLVWVALGGYAAVLLVTNLWFLPELMKLVRAPDGTFQAGEWRRCSVRWERASIARGVLMVGLTVPLVAALAA
ncbi:hypothetical protein [Pseudonocardia sp. TRM90224]|uniref:hypothetical protein n=1 Tax=Pseudonocardia sp. TRM90224 TaxID=2812678 RepID=UPI001E2A1F2F|nr:hypothetical protein [Pseudonocardia sp. TRM90224]